MRFARLPLCVLTVAICTVLLGATPASAIVECDSPDLPPGCGEYRTPAEVHAAFANPDPAIIELILKDVSHSCCSRDWGHLIEYQMMAIDTGCRSNFKPQPK